MKGRDCNARKTTCIAAKTYYRNFPANGSLFSGIDPDKETVSTVINLAIALTVWPNDSAMKGVPSIFI